MALSVVVTANQNCSHAASVIEAVRTQIDAEDELIIVEPGDCGCRPELDVPFTEKHLAAGSTDDFELRIRGLAASTGDIVLALEDHGVPEPHMIETLKNLLATHPDLEAVTFFLRNGTRENAASRAAFAYVGGFADADGPEAVPGLVASSFALRGAPLEEARAKARAGTLRPGHIEYEVLPDMSNAGLDRLPRQLTLRHDQRNSVRNAVSAVYWNARHAGWVERGAHPAGGPVVHMAHRYLGRSYLLVRDRDRDLAESGTISLLGMAGFAGWWLGRVVGPGKAADKLRAAHPIPAA